MQADSKTEADPLLADEKGEGSDAKPARFRFKCPSFMRYFPAGVFGKNNSSTESIATFFVLLILLGAAGMLGKTLVDYIAYGLVKVPIEGEAHLSLEVPSIGVCPYTADANLTSQDMGGIKGRLILNGHKMKGGAKNCKWTGTEDKCHFGVGNGEQDREAPRVNEDCCCFKRNEDQMICETNPKIARPYVEEDRQCYFLDMAQWTVNSVQNDDMKPETFEFRTSYAISVPSGVKSAMHNAVRFSFSTSKNHKMKSHFYADVGSFMLGTVQKESYEMNDWFKNTHYDNFVLSSTTLKEENGRGKAKCGGLPPAVWTMQHCAEDGCQTEAKESADTNYCTRLFLQYDQFFITRGVSFGSVTNIWGIIALLSIMATQLNNVNLIQLFFPFKSKKIHHREVSTPLYYASCCLLRSTHEDTDSDSSSESGEELKGKVKDEELDF